MVTQEARLEAPSLLARGRRGIDRYGWRALTREVAVRTLRPAMAPAAARRLERRADSVQSLDQLLDLAFDFRAFGVTIRPSQSRWELHRLLAEVQRVRPRAMLEIGTANGGSLFAFTRSCAPDAHVISVDLPHGDFGGGYPRWKVPVYNAFSSPGQRLDLLRGDSHDPQTLARVEELLGSRRLDFLFIDGDHTYDGVKRDFELYKGLVRPGGLIGFHDIAPQDSPAGPEGFHMGGEVPRFWTELKERHGGQELLDPRNPGYFGIGLIQAQTRCSTDRT